MQTLKFLAAAVVASSLAGAAYAGPTNTITQTGDVADQATDFTTGFSVTGGANSTTFAGFNAALGTLNSVAITYSVNGTETGTLTNTSASTQTFKFDSQSNISAIDAGNGNTPAALVSYLSSGLTLAEPITQYTLAGNGGTTSILPSNNGFSNSPLSESTTFTGANADEFIGKNFSLDLSTLTGSSFFGGGGNIKTNLTTFAGGDISIVYNYTPMSTPVPEPATFAALGAGLLGLTFVRLRKRA